MGGRIQHLRRAAARLVIDRPFAFQPVGRGFKGGEGLRLAVGRNDKGQELAPANLDQIVSFGEVIRSRAKGVWKSGKGEATIAATPSRLEGA